MAAQSVEDVLKQAARLSPEERLMVATRLIEGVRHVIPAGASKPLKWRNLRGRLPYPAFGEDAKVYVSRARREDSAHRDRQLKRNL